MAHTYLLTVVTEQPLVDSTLLRDQIGDMMCPADVTGIVEVDPGQGDPAAVLARIAKLVGQPLEDPQSDEAVTIREIRALLGVTVGG